MASVLVTERFASAILAGGNFLRPFNFQNFSDIQDRSPMSGTDQLTRTEADTRIARRGIEQGKQ